MSTALDNLYDLPEQICYMECGYCSTILLVNVPISSLSCVFVTVRCGHCTNILSLNLTKASFFPLHFMPSVNQQQEMVQQPKKDICSEKIAADEKAAAKTCNPPFWFSSDEEDYDEDSVSINQIKHKPPLKKLRTPSAYNQFVKEEIKRLKIAYPNITHKQAFSAAAKNSQFNGGKHVQDIGEGAQTKITVDSDADDEEETTRLWSSTSAKGPFN